MNLYGYVSNNPGNLIDPLGLLDGPPYNYDDFEGRGGSLPWTDEGMFWPGVEPNPNYPVWPSGPSPGAVEGMGQIIDGVTGLMPYVGPFMDIADILQGICKLVGLCPPDDPCEKKGK